MSLKKYLESGNLFTRKGQTMIEYFILLTIIATFTIVAATSWLGRIKDSGEATINAAVHTMTR